MVDAPKAITPTARNAMQRRIGFAIWSMDKSAIAAPHEIIPSAVFAFIVTKPGNTAFSVSLWKVHPINTDAPRETTTKLSNSTTRW
jgi:hypothetical protein